MDVYTPQLLDLGLAGMIGKGKRSDAVKQAIIRNQAVYFAAVGGAGALLGLREKAETIAFEDLQKRSDPAAGGRGFRSSSVSTVREMICTLRILNDRRQRLSGGKGLPL